VAWPLPGLPWRVPMLAYRWWSRRGQLGMAGWRARCEEVGGVGRGAAGAMDCVDQLFAGDEAGKGEKEIASEASTT
jgi:hypothetical protein